MVVAPIGGAILYPRYGGRPLLAAGLAFQAVAMLYLHFVIDPGTAYFTFVPGFVMGGIGMGLVFASSASMILDAVRASEAGQAAGAAATLREVGGVFGVAVMATVFQSHGSYASPQAYSDGVAGALPIAVGVLAFGAVAGALLPGRRALAAIAERRAADEASGGGATGEVEVDAAREVVAA